MFNLNSYIKEKAQVIDKALTAALPAEDVRPTVLHKAMHYSIFPGGKRLRPVLCLAAAEAVGSDSKKAINPAVAIELLHSYTLIHDDLPSMDDDDVRREKPSCHIAFGEANAILAGDAIQALAFEILARTEISLPYSPVCLVSELAHAAGSLGVAGGQVEDLAFNSNAPDSDDIEYIHLHKTADLFRCTVRMGAITGTATESQLDAISRYGTNLGLAFQIADDLLDEKKIEQKEASCLLVCDTDTARKKGETLIANAISAVDDLNNNKGKEALIAIARIVMTRKT